MTSPKYRQLGIGAEDPCAPTARCRRPTLSVGVTLFIGVCTRMCVSKHFRSIRCLAKTFQIAAGGYKMTLCQSFIPTKNNETPSPCSRASNTLAHWERLYVHYVLCSSQCPVCSHCQWRPSQGRAQDHPAPIWLWGLGRPSSPSGWGRGRVLAEADRRAWSDQTECGTGSQHRSANASHGRYLGKKSIANPAVSSWLVFMWCSRIKK